TGARWACRWRARGRSGTTAGGPACASAEPVRAIEVVEPNYRLFVREHDRYCAAVCALTLGRAQGRLGNAAAARAYLDEAERLFRALGNLGSRARVLYFRASLLMQEGNLP